MQYFQFMKNIFLVFLLIGFLFPLMINGQAPGYLGKKAVVSLNYSVFPAFLGPTKNNRGYASFENESGESSNNIGLNSELNLGFEYTIGRYRSLSLHLGQYATGVKMDDVETFSGDYDLLLKANVRSIELIISRYKRKKAALAPVGNSFYWGFKRDFVKSSVKEEERLSNGTGAITPDFDQKVAFNFFLFGWSNNQVFWDKVFFKTGLHMAIPLKLRGLADLTDSNGSSFYDSNQEYYERNVYSRLVFHEFIRFDIGVGYLLF